MRDCRKKCINNRGRLCLGCSVCLRQSFCQLIAAGCTASVAGNTADTAYDFIYRHAFYEFWDSLQITIAATGKFYILYDVAV